MSAEDLQALDAEQKRSLVAKIEAPYKSRADDVSNLASLPSLKREFVLLTSEHPPSPALKKLQADVVAKVPSELSDALKSMHISAAASSDEPSLATAATAAAASSKFRRRRLTFASTPRKGGSSDVDPGEECMFRAVEIGEKPAAPPPFPGNIVGTFSCHGIEPSYESNGDAVSKINQDRGCMVYPFAGNERQALFCVFDGHGEKGDLVSHTVMHEIQKRLAVALKLKDDPPAALKAVFLEVDQFLKVKLGTAAKYSGTTAVAVLLRDSHVWVANAGDSRAIVATGSDPSKLVARDLSRDHNPDSPGEKERILAAGGFVSPPPEPGLSARVWLDKKMTQVGLAMARSIGDHAVKGVGVIAEPEITQFDFTADDQWMVLASDGVWEFIESQEAVDIATKQMAVVAKPSAEKACQALIEQAALRWRHFEGDYRDDITAIIVRLSPFDLLKTVTARADRRSRAAFDASDALDEA